MDVLTVLVLADPADRRLPMLERLPAETRVAAGNKVEAFSGMAPDAEVIFNFQLDGSLLRQVIPMCPKLRWVHAVSAGLDRVLSPELQESPAVLTNGSGVFSDVLGEYAVGAILHFAKDFRRIVRSQEAGRWDPFDVLPVAGRTAGIVGYGDIGRAVASRARALGMRVLACRRRPGGADPFAEEVFGPDRLREMLPRCDYVIVAAPLTPETRGMMGETELRAMKADAVIVNIGRGPVIDEVALISALREKRLKGAALDVFDQEPLPAGHPFYALDNVLLSAHCADRTADMWEQGVEFFLKNFGLFHKGEPLLSVVDKKAGY